MPKSPTNQSNNSTSALPQDNSNLISKLSSTTASPNQQTKSFENLLKLLLELQLTYNLSPKLSKAQIKKLKLSFYQIVKE
jgi:hypothetical protein